jgi:serine/threonine protein phosphatase PrpC
MTKNKYTIEIQTKYNIKLILLILILVITIVFTRFKSKSSFQNTYAFIREHKKNPYSSKPIDIPLKIKYKKCNYLKLQNTLDTIFNKYKFDRVDENKDNWDIYILCGYNYAETELKKIKITHPNQKVYAIRGCDKIASKNELWKIVKDFYGFEKASQLIPESYIINDPNDIKMFTKRFNKNKLYLLKKNIQRKEGILITNDYKKILRIVKNTKKDIRNFYNPYIFDANTNLDDYYNELISKNNKIKTKNTNNYIAIKKEEKNVKEEEDLNKNQKINSLINNYKIIQTYIDDLYLVNKRKCNLRLYILIVCNKGDKKAYLYNQGKCIYTNKDYDNSKHTVVFDKEQHLTSYLLDQDIYKTHPESLDDLSQFMGNKKFKCLWNQINILLINIMASIYGKICNSKKLNDILTFQLFGADIIFTKNLHPYLLEFNKGPSMKYMNHRDKMMKLKLTEDVFKQVNIIPFKKGEKSNFTEIK